MGKRSEYSVAFLEVLADVLHKTTKTLEQGINHLHCNPLDYDLGDVQCALTPYIQQCQHCQYWLQPSDIMVDPETALATCSLCAGLDTWNKHLLSRDNAKA